MREALPYIDAIAIQPTSRELNAGSFDDLYQRYNKPIYIADHVSSFATDKNPVTMGQVAKSPEVYADYYERYVTAALSRSYMIGYNKCQYQDEPTPTMLKQGILKLDESAYPTADRVRDANLKALKNAYQDADR